MALSKITPESINLASDFAGMGFGGTGAANQLDDYEEGTWTPSFVAGSSAVTYTAQDGRYIKIGNLVIANFEIQMSAWTGTGSFAEIGGLPFTIFNTDANRAACAALIDALTTTINNIVIQPTPSQTKTVLIQGNNGTSSHTGVAGNKLTSATIIRSCITYVTG